MRNLLGRILLRSLFLAAATAAVSYSSTVERAIDEYKSRTGLAFEYVLAPGAARVARLTGDVSLPMEGEPTESARRFLSENGAMFGVTREDVMAARTTVLKSRDGSHVSLVQVCDGVPVFGPATMVHLDDSGKIFLVKNNFRPGLRAPAGGKPAVTPDDALALARIAARDLGPDPMFSAPEAGVLIEGGEPRLVYRIPAWATGGRYHSSLILVDCLNPDVVPRVISTTTTATGTGTIYPENPLTTPLQSLEFTDLDSSTKLAGTYAKTYNANETRTYPSKSSELKNYTTAQESDRDYTFDPDADLKFSEAMAYRHVTAVRNGLMGIGMDPQEWTTQVPVFVNVQDPSDLSDGYDNAFYTRATYDAKLKKTGFLCFGAGEVLNNLAHDSDVMFHEAGHLALDRIQPKILEELDHNYGGAYHEGWGDMLACGLNGNSKLAEYGLRSVSGSTWYGRNIDNKRKYPNNVYHPDTGLSEVHHTGEIMGGVFWDAYKTMGGYGALQAFMEGNYLLDGSENFFGVRDAVATAARGRATGLAAAFEKHGIKGADPGNKGKITQYTDLYTGLYLFGYVFRQSSFTRGSWIVLMFDATVSGSTKAYNVVPTLTVSNLSKFDAVMQLNTEATNGTRSWGGQDPYFAYILFSGNKNPKGTYNVTLKTRLGGTAATMTRTATFKIQ